MSGPRRIAVIDVGSNSVRLLVVRALSDEAFEVVDEERFDARLGAGQAAGGDLQPAAFQRGVRAMEVMAAVARAHQPDSIVAVGTEALRQAANAGDFIDEVEQRTRIPIRVLSADEEARAAFLGVVNSTAIEDGHIVDIGGGSLEIVRVAGRSAEETLSAPLGALYATERYFRADPPAGRDVRALRKAVRQRFQPSTTGGALVGTGGAVRNLARIIRLRQRYPLRRLHGYELPAREIQRLATSLVTTDAEGRRRMAGVSSGRADTLAAAAVVIDEVIQVLGADRLLVSGQGLREGLAWQELRPDGAIIADVRSASVTGLGLANGVDDEAASAVTDAAASLFATTAALHGLGPPELALLRAAARLSRIGMHIDYYSRDRHAEYLVHSGDLHGFSHREIVLLAALVRWAGSGEPDLAAYPGVVEPEDARRVAILGGLLGAAGAIHRRPGSPVQGVEASLDGRYLRLRLTGIDALVPEVHELERQQRRLESLFGVQVSVTVTVSG